jgi:hypothetical protein
MTTFDKWTSLVTLILAILDLLRELLGGFETIPCMPVFC